MQARQRRVSADTYEIQGRIVTMPAIVRDASSGNAIFLVPSAVAQSLVGDAFEVVEMAPGQTQLILGFVDYRDNDLGDYNEVMMIFMVRPRGEPDEPEGTFIYKLPVNQSFTCEAGCTIWGFPKSVEQIDVDYRSDRVSCALTMGGQHVFTLSVPRGKADAGDAPDMEMATYTYLDGPTVVRFTTGGPTAVSPGADGVELTLGTHPLADELRRLGLPAPAMMSTWMEHMHGSFGAPRKL
jgi:Acetoacetate decarboxylase (ADC)